MSFYNVKKSSTTNKLFTNAILVDPENNREIKGDLLVVDGKIDSFGDELKGKKLDDIEKIDCEGKHLAPGLIELQCHIGESGGEYKESIKQTTKSAVAGGFTTINIMPDTSPVIDSTTILEFIKNRAKKKSYCNISIFGSMTKSCAGEELSEIGLLKKAGISGISEGCHSVEDSKTLKHICEYAKNFDVKIAHQANDSSLSKNGVINEGEVSTRLGVEGIPNIAEKISLERDLAIANQTGCHFHSLNISAEESIETIRNYKEKNSNITASVTPHHISLTDVEAENFRTFAKTFPPLRRDQDRLFMIKSLKEGIIDFISCNNTPRSEDQKRLSLEAAEFGVIGLETSFAATYTALKDHGFSVSEIVKLLSTNVAEYLGLENKGKLKKGCVADLFLFDINSNIIINPDEFSGSSVNTPFDGKALSGEILKTFVFGEIAYEK